MEFESVLVGSNLRPGYSVEIGTLQARQGMRVDRGLGPCGYNPRHMEGLNHPSWVTRCNHTEGSVHFHVLMTAS